MAQAAEKAGTKSSADSEHGAANYRIPRKIRPKEGVVLLDINSRDGRDILDIVRKSYLDQSYSSRWEPVSVSYVKCSFLEEKFRKKRQEMRELDRTGQELLEGFAFTMLAKNNTNLLYRIINEGLVTKRTPFNAFGDSAKGVYVGKHADVMLKFAENFPSKEIRVVIHKILLGKRKCIPDNSLPDLEPTPNYDCHVPMQEASLSQKLDVQVMKSQVYLYEYNDDGLPVSHPRQCLPHAVITYKLQARTAPEKNCPKILPAKTVSSSVSPVVTATATTPTCTSLLTVATPVVTQPHTVTTAVAHLPTVTTAVVTQPRTITTSIVTQPSTTVMTPVTVLPKAVTSNPAIISLNPNINQQTVIAPQAGHSQMPIVSPQTVVLQPMVAPTLTAAPQTVAQQTLSIQSPLLMSPPAVIPQTSLVSKTVRPPVAGSHVVWHSDVQGLKTKQTVASGGGRPQQLIISPAVQSKQAQISQQQTVVPQAKLVTQQSAVSQTIRPKKTMVPQGVKVVVPQKKQMPSQSIVVTIPSSSMPTGSTLVSRPSLGSAHIPSLVGIRPLPHATLAPTLQNVTQTSQVHIGGVWTTCGTSVTNPAVNQPPKILRVSPATGVWSQHQLAQTVTGVNQQQHKAPKTIILRRVNLQSPEQQPQKQHQLQQLQQLHIEANESSSTPAYFSGVTASPVPKSSGRRFLLPTPCRTAAPATSIPSLLSLPVTPTTSMQSILRQWQSPGIVSTATSSIQASVNIPQSVTPLNCSSPVMGPPVTPIMIAPIDYLDEEDPIMVKEEPIEPHTKKEGYVDLTEDEVPADHTTLPVTDLDQGRTTQFEAPGQDVIHSHSDPNINNDLNESGNEPEDEPNEDIPGPSTCNQPVPTVACGPTNQDAANQIFDIDCAGNDSDATVAYEEASLFSGGSPTSKTPTFHNKKSHNRTLSKDSSLEEEDMVIESSRCSRKGTRSIIREFIRTAPDGSVEFVREVVEPCASDHIGESAIPDDEFSSNRVPKKVPPKTKKPSKAVSKKSSGSKKSSKALTSRETKSSEVQSSEMAQTPAAARIAGLPQTERLQPAAGGSEHESSLATQTKTAHNETDLRSSAKSKANKTKPASIPSKCAKKGAKGRNSRPKQPRPDRMKHGHIRPINFQELRAQIQQQAAVNRVSRVEEPSLDTDPTEDDFHNFDVNLDLEDSPTCKHYKILVTEAGRSPSQELVISEWATNPKYQPYVRLVDIGKSFSLMRESPVENIEANQCKDGPQSYTQSPRPESGVGAWKAQQYGMLQKRRLAWRPGIVKKAMKKMKGKTGSPNQSPRLQTSLEKWPEKEQSETPSTSGLSYNTVTLEGSMSKLCNNANFPPGRDVQTSVQEPLGNKKQSEKELEPDRTAPAEESTSRTEVQHLTDFQNEQPFVDMTNVEKWFMTDTNMYGQSEESGQSTGVSPNSPSRETPCGGLLNDLNPREDTSIDDGLDHTEAYSSIKITSEIENKASDGYFDNVLNDSCLESPSRAEISIPGIMDESDKTEMDLMHPKIPGILEDEVYNDKSTKEVQQDSPDTFDQNHSKDSANDENTQPFDDTTQLEDGCQQPIPLENSSGTESDTKAVSKSAGDQEHQELPIKNESKDTCEDKPSHDQNRGSEAKPILLDEDDAMLLLALKARLKKAKTQAAKETLLGAITLLEDKSSQETASPEKESASTSLREEDLKRDEEKVESTEISEQENHECQEMTAVTGVNEQSPETTESKTDAGDLTQDQKEGQGVDVASKAAEVYIHFQTDVQEDVVETSEEPPVTKQPQREPTKAERGMSTLQDKRWSILNELVNLGSESPTPSVASADSHSTESTLPEPDYSQTPVPDNVTKDKDGPQSHEPEGTHKTAVRRNLAKGNESDVISISSDSPEQLCRSRLRDNRPDLDRSGHAVKRRRSLREVDSQDRQLRSSPCRSRRDQRSERERRSRSPVHRRSRGKSWHRRHERTPSSERYNSKDEYTQSDTESSKDRDNRSHRHRRKIRRSPSPRREAERDHPRRKDSLPSGQEKRRPNPKMPHKKSTNLEETKANESSSGTDIGTKNKKPLFIDSEVMKTMMVLKPVDNKGDAPLFDGYGRNTAQGPSSGEPVAGTPSADPVRWLEQLKAINKKAPSTTDGLETPSVFTQLISSVTSSLNLNIDGSKKSDKTSVPDEEKSKDIGETQDEKEQESPAECNVATCESPTASKDEEAKPNHCPIEIPLESAVKETPEPSPVSPTCPKKKIKINIKTVLNRYKAKGLEGDSESKTPEAVTLLASPPTNPVRSVSDLIESSCAIFDQTNRSGALENLLPLLHSANPPVGPKGLLNIPNVEKIPHQGLKEKTENISRTSFPPISVNVIPKLSQTGGAVHNNHDIQARGQDGQTPTQAPDGKTPLSPRVLPPASAAAVPADDGMGNLEHLERNLGKVKSKRKEIINRLQAIKERLAQTSVTAEAADALNQEHHILEKYMSQVLHVDEEMIKRELDLVRKNVMAQSNHLMPASVLLPHERETMRTATGIPLILVHKLGLSLFQTLQSLKNDLDATQDELKRTKPNDLQKKRNLHMNLEFLLHERDKMFKSACTVSNMFKKHEELVNKLAWYRFAHNDLEKEYQHNANPATLERMMFVRERIHDLDRHIRLLAECLKIGQNKPETSSSEGAAIEGPARCLSKTDDSRPEGTAARQQHGTHGTSGASVAPGSVTTSPPLTSPPVPSVVTGDSIPPWLQQRKQRKKAPEESIDGTDITPSPVADKLSTKVQSSSLADNGDKKQCKESVTPTKTDGKDKLRKSIDSLIESVTSNTVDRTKRQLSNDEEGKDISQLPDNIPPWCKRAKERAANRERASVSSTGQQKEEASSTDTNASSAKSSEKSLTKGPQQEGKVQAVPLNQGGKRKHLNKQRRHSETDRNVWKQSAVKQLCVRRDDGRNATEEPKLCPRPMQEAALKVETAKKLKTLSSEGKQEGKVISTERLGLEKLIRKKRSHSSSSTGKEHIAEHDIASKSKKRNLGQCDSREPPKKCIDVNSNEALSSLNKKQYNVIPQRPKGHVTSCDGSMTKRVIPKRTQVTSFQNAKHSKAYMVENSRKGSKTDVSKTSKAAVANVPGPLKHSRDISMMEENTEIPTVFESTPSGTRQLGKKRGQSESIVANRNDQKSTVSLKREVQKMRGNTNVGVTESKPNKVALGSKSTVPCSGPKAIKQIPRNATSQRSPGKGTIPKTKSSRDKKQIGTGCSSKGRLNLQERLCTPVISSKTKQLDVKEQSKESVPSVEKKRMLDFSQQSLSVMKTCQDNDLKLKSMNEVMKMSHDNVSQVSLQEPGGVDEYVVLDNWTCSDNSNSPKKHFSENSSKSSIVDSGQQHGEKWTEGIHDNRRQPAEPPIEHTWAIKTQVTDRGPRNQGSALLQNVRGRQKKKERSRQYAEWRSYGNRQGQYWDSSEGFQEDIDGINSHGNQRYRHVEGQDYLHRNDRRQIYESSQGLRYDVKDYNHGFHGSSSSAVMQSMVAQPPMGGNWHSRPAPWTPF